MSLRFLTIIWDHVTEVLFHVIVLQSWKYIAKLSPSSSFGWAEFSFNFNFTPPWGAPPPPPPGKVGKLEI
jgi:hypothetical protein